MTAGIVTLKTLQQPGVWEQLEAAVDELTAGIAQAASAASVPIQQTRAGTMFATFFSETPVTDWPTASGSDTDKFGRYFQAMLEEGVYIAPSQFEAGFMSTAHNTSTIAKTAEAAMNAMRA
jgi:glutamate-1-semialdehyde 2,1-aminomutase